MFYGNNGCHPVSDIGSGKIGIFLLQNSQFSCVLVHNYRKPGFKTGQMGSAFHGIDVITKSHDIFLEIFRILEGNFYFNPFLFPFVGYDITDRLFSFIQFSDISCNSFRLVIGFILRFPFSFIDKMKGKGRV